MHTHLACPALPRGVAVLGEVAGHTHIGLGPTRSVVIDGPPAAVSQWLGGVDGRRTTVQQAREAERFGLDPDDARQVLALLAAAGFLELHWPHSADPTDPAPRRVAVIGAPRVVGSICGGLAAHGIESEAVQVGIRSKAATGHDVEAAVREAVRASRGADWAIIALARAAPDLLEASISDRLVAFDVPHLAVAAHPTARFGPLVLPGSTPCLRCELLGDCDADPDWRTIVADWSAQPPPTPDACVLAAVVAEVTRWANDATTVLAAWTCERRLGAADRVAHVRMAEGGGGPWLSRRLDHHPDCGCGWGDMLRALPATAGRE